MLAQQEEKKANNKNVKKEWKLHPGVAKRINKAQTYLDNVYESAPTFENVVAALGMDPLELQFRDWEGELHSATYPRW